MKKLIGKSPFALAMLSVMMLTGANMNLAALEQEEQKVESSSDGDDGGKVMPKDDDDESEDDDLIVDRGRGSRQRQNLYDRNRDRLRDRRAMNTWRSDAFFFRPGNANFYYYNDPFPNYDGYYYDPDSNVYYYYYR